MGDIAYRIVSMLDGVHHFSHTSVIFETLNEIGYEKMQHLISEHELYGELCKRPEYAMDWYTYSRDKRTYGWFIVPDRKGRFCIGNDYDESGVHLVIGDFVHTCAAFIKMEIDTFVSYKK